MSRLLLLSVFVIATCGLVYELIAGTAASYLLGDSVTQFSTIIGCYLFAMGIGSWLSRYVNQHLLAFFVKVEILVGLVGGSSAAILFLLFNAVESFRLLLYLLVGLVGVLVGVEIPILLRILEKRFEFKDLVSKVFTFDYIGALFASIVFPLVLVPKLGLMRSSFLFGILNTVVAIVVVTSLKAELPAHRRHLGAALGVLVVLVMGFAYSPALMNLSDDASYPGKVIYSQATPYQRIVITRQVNDIRLFLNANLQFSSIDEYRYHEALVHPALSRIEHPQRVLVIGGGDGLAVREILKYPTVTQVTLVDLDPAMSTLFTHNALLTQLNQWSFLSPKVHVIHQDGFLWLRQQTPDLPKYDAIIIDLPDPSNYSIGKLYSLTFFKALHAITTPKTLIVIQSTSPLIARQSFWCVSHTLQAAGFVVTPYHVYVPSFGEWGFVMGSYAEYLPPDHYPAGMRYISPDTAKEMFHFPADMSDIPTKIQQLNEQPLIHYFDEEWSRYLGGSV